MTSLEDHEHFSGSNNNNNNVIIIIFILLLLIIIISSSSSMRRSGWLDEPTQQESKKYRDLPTRADLVVFMPVMM